MVETASTCMYRVHGMDRQVRHSLGHAPSSTPQPLALARRPRTIPRGTKIENIDTGVRQRTVMPPLARWINLVRNDDAS